jgi:hypothetical protein
VHTLRYQWLSVFALCIGLCACGGNNAAVPLAQGPAGITAPSGMAQAKLRFGVPWPSSRQRQSGLKKPKYVSHSTVSISVALTAVNGATPSPLPSPQVFNVTSTTGGCGPDTNNNLLVFCTLSVPLPIGDDTIMVSARDAGGDILSQQIAPITVTLGNTGPNASIFTLDANPQNATITVTPPIGVSGTQAGGFTVSRLASPQVFTVSLTDAALQPIVGPGLPILSGGSGTPATATLTASDADSTLTIAPVPTASVGSSSLITVTETPANSESLFTGTDGLSLGSTTFTVTLGS